jgi:hypothetical protein
MNNLTLVQVVFASFLILRGMTGELAKLSVSGI